MAERFLILGPSWLGDAVMAIPAYRALREARPDAHIAVLARTQVADLYRCIPHIDEIILYRRQKGIGKLLGYTRLIGDLQRLNATTALILPRSFGSAWTALLSDIPRRIGYAAAGRQFLMTESIPREQRLLETHRVHYFLNALTALGIDGKATVPHLAPLPEAVTQATTLLSEHPRGSNGPLVIFNPGANYGSAKQWPEERYSSLGRRLVAKRDARIVLVGGPGDRDVCDRIHHEIGADAALDLAGRTTIPELAEVCRLADVMISNDTGAMHVGAAVGQRILAIFGSTDPITTAPYGPGHTILQEPVPCAPCLLRTCPIDHRCMTRITVDQVEAACDHHLATIGALESGT